MSVADLFEPPGPGGDIDTDSPEHGPDVARIAQVHPVGGVERCQHPGVSFAALPILVIGRSGPGADGLGASPPSDTLQIGPAAAVRVGHVGSEVGR